MLSYFYVRHAFVAEVRNYDYGHVISWTETMRRRSPVGSDAVLTVVPTLDMWVEHNEATLMRWLAKTSGYRKRGIRWRYGEGDGKGDYDTGILSFAKVDRIPLFEEWAIVNGPFLKAEMREEAQRILDFWGPPDDED